MTLTLDPGAVLPDDATSALLLGRVFDPAVGGPTVVAVVGDRLVDLGAVAPTVSQLLERDDPAALVRAAIDREASRDEVTLSATPTTPAPSSWALADVLGATAAGRGDAVRLLAPIDLQAIKAAGVTFVSSMLERVVEERAAGDASLAVRMREKLADAVGGAIGSVVPGSEEAARVKAALLDEGMWSQYLEVGIGPDPEIFTKAPVLSAVGSGSPVGVLERSTWNNPEPELVLVTDSRGRPLGATLGNDVNLRDFEGRSALLLGKAKDNNASCALGPFIRLFDEGYSIEDARGTEIDLVVSDDAGYRMEGRNSVARISRPFEELIGAAIGRHHQYPDGLALFTGTLFSPTQDRDEPGLGFTHHLGDVVTISSPRLGSLVNTVGFSERAPEWTFGIAALMTNLAARGLLAGAAR